MLAAAAAVAVALLLAARPRVVRLLRGAPREAAYTPAPSQLRQAAASALRDASAGGAGRRRLHPAFPHHMAPLPAHQALHLCVQFPAHCFFGYPSAMSV